MDSNQKKSQEERDRVRVVFWRRL